MSTDEIRNFTSANKAAWEASAHLHAAGKSWDELLSSAKLPGFSILDPHLTEVLQRLKPDGKRAVQIGCNNARELLSLASLGMKPELGIDQSANFLMQARQLAQATGLSPRFVEADVYDLPNDLGTFDLALITIGVLNWMPELPRFFQIVSQLLTDKGMLVIYETHPFLELFDPASDTPFAPAFSYFDGRPQEVRESIAYDGKDHGEGETGYWFIHPLGDIVTACAGAGLTIVELKEFPHTIREPEYDIYEGQKAQVPMSYFMIARK